MRAPGGRPTPCAPHKPASPPSGKSPYGPFYINEYKQVIVPVGDASDYYFAAPYEKPLIFEFEAKTVSGEARDFDGRHLQPGDTWVGPHAGIPYVLTAAGDD